LSSLLPHNQEDCRRLPTLFSLAARCAIFATTQAINRNTNLQKQLEILKPIPFEAIF
jgi:hypothetical protein